MTNHNEKVMLGAIFGALIGLFSSGPEGAVFGGFICATLVDGFDDT